MQVEQRCGNCIWFKPFTDSREAIPTSQVGPHVEDSDFGACKALFFDNDGQMQRYDRTTYFLSPCIASDDDGNLLFEDKHSQEFTVIEIPASE